MRPDQQQSAGQGRARAHDHATIATVDGNANREGSQAGNDQADRRRAEECGFVQSKVVAHSFGDHGKTVIKGSPTDDLADTQSCDETTRSRLRHGGGCCVSHGWCSRKGLRGASGFRR